MTDREVQRRLNQLVRLCNDLDAEAKRRYGSEGMLFYESEGGFYLMSGDSDNGNVTARQEHVQFHSTGVCNLGSGSW